MKIAEFMRLAETANRCDAVVGAERPETLIGGLNNDELELVRAAIRLVMAERRDNIIERLGLQIDEEV